MIFVIGILYTSSSSLSIKKLQKEGVSEDEAKDAESDVQEITNNYILKVDKHLELKDKEIMSV